MKKIILLVTLIGLIGMGVDKYKQNIVPVSDFEIQNLILVNKNNELDSKYEPEDLVLIKDNKGKDILIKKQVEKSYQKLYKDALKQGINISVISGYRSYEYQKNIYERNVKKDGEEIANSYSAKPGESEHQTGFAIDIGSGKCDLEQCFEDTKEGKWLFENAHKYGFILRYPENKTEITGYIYEPWHYRYVGINNAKAIYDSEVTLEEYLKYEN